MAQLEKLGDEDLSPEELRQEIERSKAIAVLARPILENGRLMLAAEKFKQKNGLRLNGDGGSLPKMLTSDK